MKNSRAKKRGLSIQQTMSDCFFIFVSIPKGVVLSFLYCMIQYIAALNMTNAVNPYKEK